MLTNREKNKSASNAVKQATSQAHVLVHMSLMGKQITISGAIQLHLVRVLIEVEAMAKEVVQVVTEAGMGMKGDIVEDTMSQGGVGIGVDLEIKVAIKDTMMPMEIKEVEDTEVDTEIKMVVVTEADMETKAVVATAEDMGTQVVVDIEEGTKTQVDIEEGIKTQVDTEEAILAKEEALEATIKEGRSKKSVIIVTSQVIGRHNVRVLKNQEVEEEAEATGEVAGENLRIRIKQDQEKQIRFVKELNYYFGNVLRFYHKSLEI